MIAIDIQKLCKTYENGLQALKGIDLQINEGDFFALLGPNGAGKSTAINILTSLAQKTSGAIKIFDVDFDEKISRAKSFLGVVPQEINFLIFEKIINVLLYNAGYYGVPLRVARQRAEYYLKKLDLWEKRNQAVMTLSGGMKRRLMIARALMHEPKILLLDEPTAGVDVELRRSLWAFLRELNQKGLTIVLTTHYLEEAEQLCNRVAMIQKGQIVLQGLMHEVIHQLDSEIFVLELSKEFSSFPENDGCIWELLEPKKISVTIPRDHTLTYVVNVLSKAGVDVLSARGKENRLETLFLRMTAEHQAQEG